MNDALRGKKMTFLDLFVGNGVTVNVVQAIAERL
jgi:hypothetical protein